MRLGAGGVVTAAATGIGVLAVASHVGLIPAASWGSDEFVTFALLRDGRLHYFLYRLLSWSPRPVSEGLLWGYQQVVAASGRQLIVPFLLLVWSAMPVAVFGALGVRSRIAWLLGWAVISLFLLGHAVAEVFYWPMGAGAYVLGLAGVTYTVLRLARARPLSPGGIVACIVAMLVAAGSSELGIVFVATLCVAWPAFEAAGRGSIRAVGRLAWLAIPLAAALVLGWMLLNGRVAQGIERMVPAPEYFHHPWPSLLAAMSRFGAEIISTGETFDAPSHGLERLDRLLFVVGATLCLRAGGIAPGSAGRLLALAVALGVAAYVSLASAFDQFGALCCERHATVRSCLYVLMLVVLAFALSRIRLLDRIPRSWVAVAGPALVGLAVLLPLIGSMSALRADYASESARIAARDANWRDGHDPATSKMEFRMLAHGRIVDGFEGPAGANVLTGPASGFALGVMHYFGKSEVLMLNGP